MFHFLSNFPSKPSATTQNRSLFSLWLLLGLLLQYPCFGQDFSFRLIDKARGLPTNTVYDIVQDKRGFIWLGTDRGLYRYDGREYKLYFSKKQDGKSLSNLIEDGDGRIWCQNFSGQFFYTQADSLRFCEQLVPTGGYIPVAIMPSQKLISIGKQKIRILDLKTFSLIEQPTDEILTPFSSKDARFYYIYSNIINKIVGIDASGQRTEIALPKSQTYFFHAKIANKFYLAPKINAEYITVFENGKILDKIYLTQKSLIQNFKVIDERHLGIFTSSGFYLIDTQSSKRKYSPYLSNKNITSLIKDQEGSFWVSTINSGVLFVPSFQIKIIEPQTSFSKIQAIEADNTLFCGTAKNEIFSINTRNFKKKIYHQGQTNDEILALYVDNQRKEVLFSSNQFYKHKNGRTSVIGSAAVKDIKYFDKNNIIIAATGINGLLNLDKNDNKIVPLNSATLRYRSAAVDTATRNVYLATSGGLLKIDKQKQVTELKENNERISVLDLEIVQQPKVRIFAATTSKGIYFIENAKVTQHLTKANGLEDDVVYKIKHYKNQLWWITERAIQSYDFATKKIKTFTKADGLPEADLKDLAFVNDTIFVASSAGIVSFPIAQTSRNAYPPKIIINQFGVNNRIVQNADNQSFRYQENNMSVQFSVLGFRSADELNVFYQINNGAWLPLENSTRVLNLPSLAPNDYVVRLKAIDTDKLESKVVSLTFTIKIPFWKTYWFWSFVLGIIGLIVYILSKNHLARIRREAALESDKLTLEKDLQVHLLTAIKSQMNQHFMYNTLNAIQEQFLFGNKITASDQLSNFTQLTRQILDVSEKKSISLAVEIQILTKYLDLEKMRFSEDFTYQITLGDSIDEDYHEIPPLLIQPFAENAIRHGLLHKAGEKNLTVHFELDSLEENIICTIEDNGIGRAKAAEINEKRVREFDTFSISASEERLKLLKNDSTLKEFITYTDLEVGTRVMIMIPL